MDSDTGKGKYDLSDIMSMLDEGEKKPAIAAPKKAEARPRDDAFVKKLLMDIELKNGEILKLSSDNMTMKYALSEKDMEIQKLRAQFEARNGQVESLKAQVMSLNQQIDDLNKFASDARKKLGEMDADRAKLTARIIKEEEAPPEEEDVASIFKRIALKGEEPSGNGTEVPSKKQGTAKLYDL
jgi:predicted  nucleic acid-binding Zn-ribbon protein